MIKGRMNRKVRDAYLDLVRDFPLTSIRSRRHLRDAQRVMDELLARGKLTVAETAYLDALGDLVAAYEDVHCPMLPASDADMLRHLLEAKGITQAEFCRATKIAPSIVSEVLAGKRPFSKAMVGKTAEFFSVDRSALVANF